MENNPKAGHGPRTQKKATAGENETPTSDEVNDALATTKEVQVRVQDDNGKSSEKAAEENESDWEDVQPVEKTPKPSKSKKKSHLRAISTPNQDETHLQANVTFMERSEAADISAIPVLSPLSAKKGRQKAKVVKEASSQ